MISFEARPIVCASVRLCRALAWKLEPQIVISTATWSLDQDRCTPSPVCCGTRNGSFRFQLPNLTAPCQRPYTL